MIALNKAILPESVNVSGKFYRIKTSFKYWLRFLELVENHEKNPYSFDFLYENEKPLERIKGFFALLAFCTPKSILPRQLGGKTDEKIIDYTIDADYIYSAFYEQYKIDLLTSNMHWYEFQALFKGLHDTKLNEIIGYRLYKFAGKKKSDFDKEMEQLRRAWELPKNDNEEDEALVRFESLLYGSANVSQSKK